MAGLPIESLSEPNETWTKFDPMLTAGKLFDTSTAQLNSQFDEADAGLQKSIQHELKAAYDDYMLSMGDLRTDESMDQDQKYKKNRALNLAYQRKALGIKSQIAPQQEELASKRKLAMGQVQVQQMNIQTRMQQIQELMDRGVIDWTEGRREQLGLVGVRVPMSAVAPQTPRQRYADLTTMLRAYDQQALNYRLKTDTKTTRGLRRVWSPTPSMPASGVFVPESATEVTGQKWQIAKPEDQWAGEKFNPQTDYRDASPEEVNDIWRFRREHQQIQSEVKALRKQIGGVDFGLTASRAISPTAQVVQDNRTQGMGASPQSAEQFKAEIRRLNEVDPEQAKAYYNQYASRF